MPADVRTRRRSRSDHLLTMSAGFPTDDPWGDRQQGLDLAAFAELLRHGPSLAWTPGTTFEYSNLGTGSSAGSSRTSPAASIGTRSWSGFFGRWE